MTKAFFLPALFLTVMILGSPAAAASWQVHKADMTYYNSGMAQPEGRITGVSAQIAFDPKRPDGGTFQLSFDTTGMFIPREAIGVTDPAKLAKIARPAQPASFVAHRLKRNGDNIFAEGSLTINGQSRPIGFNMTAQESGSAASGRSLQLSGNFIINRPGFATQEMGYIGPANIPVTFEAFASTQPEASPTAEQAAPPDAPQAEPGTAAAPHSGRAPHGRTVPQQSATSSGTEEPAQPEIGKVRSFGGAPAGNETTTIETQSPPAAPPPLGTVQSFGGVQ